MLQFDELFKMEDIWTTLTKVKKPIILYGTGDGADKVINELSKRNISIDGIFASDEFVRGQSFRGLTVRNYDYFNKSIGEFIILVCFATQIPEIIQRIKELNAKHELYVPDVPVFGEGIFDSLLFNENKEKFLSVYKLLSDEKSKQTYKNILAYKLTGKLSYLFASESNYHEVYENIISPCDNCHYVDIGAYNGDTIKEFINFSKPCRITAFEPDVKNFKRLENYTKTLDVPNISLYQIAVWNKPEMLTFYSRSGRASSKDSVRKGFKSTLVKADRADNYLKDKTDYIKIDAEGAEKQVICGLSGTIKRDFPILTIAAYHRNEDLYSIPYQVLSICPKYRVYIRHFPYTTAWDTNFYFKL